MRAGLAVLVALVLALSAGSPAPADVVAFDAKAFAEAQEAGRSIVIAVHAPW
jgi:thioredoxin 1